MTNEAASLSGERRRENRTATYQLCFIAFTLELGLGIVSPLLPQLMGQFSLSAWQTGLMVTIFGFARLIADLPVGIIVARVNRTRLLLLGIGLIAVGSLGCAVAQGFLFLLAARLVMGMGTAVGLFTLLFSVSRMAKTQAMGRAVGVYQASMLAGVSISPVIGGVAASAFSWRASFLFAFCIAILAIVLVVHLSRRGAFDLPAESEATKMDQSAAIAPSAAGIPWNLVAINFTTLIFFICQAGFRNSMVPLYGGTAIGLDAGLLGLLLGGSALIRFFITLGSGFASDKYGRKRILFPGIVFLVGGALSFVFARDLPGFLLGIVILSLGGFGNSLPTTMIVDAVPRRKVGFALGMNRFVGDLGIVIGPVMLGLLLDAAGFVWVAVITAGLLVLTVPGVALTVRDRRFAGEAAASSA